MSDKRNIHTEDEVVMPDEINDGPTIDPSIEDEMIKSIAESAIFESKAKKEDDDDDDDDELEEAASADFGKWSDAKLKSWLEKNDTDEPGISPVFGQQLKRARMELAKRKKKMKKEEYNLDDDIEALTSDETGLSEDFKEKAQVIFESAINARVDKIGLELAHQYLEEEAQLEEKFEEDLQEQVELAVSTVVESVNSYLSYAISEWTKENQLAIESGIRNDISENFIAGLKTLFTENYIEVPEEKVDLVEEMAQKIEQLKEDVNKSEKTNVELFEELNEFRRQNIIEEASEDLTLSQKERFLSLCEGVEYTGDSHQFTKKIAVIKKTYFGQKTNNDGMISESYGGDLKTLGDNVDTTIDAPRKPASPMDIYANAIARHSTQSNRASSIF